MVETGCSEKVSQSQPVQKQTFACEGMGIASARGTMIDFHTHVLPGIDDGSRSLEMTEQMIKESAAQGVTAIVATPHFYAQQESFDHFLEKREQALRSVQTGSKEWGAVPRIFVGAEVYYFPNMGKADRLKELCIQGTDLLLLEMPFAQWNSDIVKDVETIINKQKCKVILAHIERYAGFQKKKDSWNEILDMPLTLQMNTGAFLSPRRRLALKLMKKYPEVILGSDCHNTDSRRPNLAEGREVIRKKYGEAVLTQIDSRAESLLKSLLEG